MHYEKGTPHVISRTSSTLSLSLSLCLFPRLIIHGIHIHTPAFNIPPDICKYLDRMPCCTAVPTNRKKIYIFYLYKILTTHRVYYKIYLEYVMWWMYGVAGKIGKFSLCFFKYFFSFLRD